MDTPPVYYVGQRVTYRDEISDPQVPATDVQDDSESVKFVRQDGTSSDVVPARVLGPSIDDPTVERYGYEAQFTFDVPGQWTIIGRSTGIGTGVAPVVVNVVALPGS